MDTQQIPKVERMDDVPLLLGFMKQMELPELLSRHFQVHGNWNGSPLGPIVCVWLAHILSQGDHCLSHVQPWASSRLRMLRESLGVNFQLNDFTDDRLADILKRIAQGECWESFETESSQTQVRLYDLQPQIVRHDSSTTFQWRKGQSEFRLLKEGHSKDRHPELAQLKVMLSTLDPLGLPLSTVGIPGNSADDPLYLPAARRVCQIFPGKRLLHVGDSKLSAWNNRAGLIALGQDYLCPLSLKQFNQAERQERILWLRKNPSELKSLERVNSLGKRVRIAQGYEWQRPLQTEWEGTPLQWSERLILVRSFRYAQAAEKKLRSRLRNVQERLVSLNEKGRGRKRPKTLEALQTLIQTQLQDSDLIGLLDVKVFTVEPTSAKRSWDFQLQVSPCLEALEQRIQSLGWQVYATSLSSQALPMDQAIDAYRREYLQEHNFRRLKGTLAIRPSYLQKEDHLEGMLHLLSIALRVLTLLEFQVRQELQKSGEPLTGIYPANPSRKTWRPSAELLLRAFCPMERIQGISGRIPLTPTQCRILKFLGLSEELYSGG